MSVTTLAALLMNLFACSQVPDAVGESAVALKVPGWITDGAGGVLYLTGEKVGVVAVNAEDGSVLWESVAASRLLVLVDHRLAVLANEPGRKNVLRVRFLDVEDKGARAGESDPLVLPEWVDVASVGNHGPGQRFELQASLVGGALHLHWTAATSQTWGTPPPPEVLKAWHRSATGLAVVDPRTGSVTMQSLPAEGEAPAAERGTPVDELPQRVREHARRDGWYFARLVGARAYGQSRKTEPRGRVVHVLQALDLATGKLVWQRPIGEELRRALPP